MKTALYSITAFFILTSSYSRETHCIVNELDAPYSDITLNQVKGNKYQMIVRKEGKVLLNQVLRFSYSRRARVTTFRNDTTEIKSLGLVVNQSVRSQYKINKISNITYTGLCKLHKK